MAYNDYGAFVYKDGRRRTDKEDVPAFAEGDTDLGPGSRIYASLMRRMAEQADEDSATPPNPLDDGRIYHGVLGDGPVRVCLYKQGMWPIRIVAVDDDGKVTELDADDVIRSYSHDYVHWHPGMSEEESKAHDRQVYGPYLYRAEVRGHLIEFEAREEDGVAKPNFRARMECPDGSVWEAWYDALYGAGHLDVGSARHAYDEWDSERDGKWGPQWRTLRIRNYEDRERWDSDLLGTVYAVRERDLSTLAKDIGIAGTEDDSGADEQGLRILYRCLRDADPENVALMGIGVESTATRYGRGVDIDLGVALELVRIGIRLGKLGVDDVDEDRSSHRWPTHGGWRPGGMGDGSSEARYGLDGTPFEGLSWHLSPRGMAARPFDKPEEESWEEWIGQRMGEYADRWEERSGGNLDIVIDRNQVDATASYPIRDAHGDIIEPLMDCPEGEPPAWQLVRPVGSDEPPMEAVGVGWRDERQVVMTVDGIFPADEMELVDDEAE